MREATIQSYIPTLRLNQRAIQLDRAQAPGPSTGINNPTPLSPYLRRHVTPSLITRGQARYYTHWSRLVQSEARYGVDPAILMAIYGKETSYGAVTGGFDLLDALASIANYLREAGWKRGVPWGTSVGLPAAFNRAAISSTQEVARCPAVFRRHSRWLPVSEWKALGVTFRRTLPDTELATLMETDGPGGPAYLLTANYRAILEYNCSNSYAMSIGLLADAIARR